MLASRVMASLRQPDPCFDASPQLEYDAPIEALPGLLCGVIAVNRPIRSSERNEVRDDVERHCQIDREQGDPHTNAYG
jgi:hypothetical protein